MSKKQPMYTDEYLISLIVKYNKENNKVPTTKDFNRNINYPNSRTYLLRFGSWEKSLELSGLISDYWWTDEKVEMMRQYYPSSSWETLLSLLHPHDKQSIHSQASKMKLKRKITNVWDEKQIEILRNNYFFGDVKNLLKLLPNHTYKAITSKAKRLNIKSREYWSDTEIEKLKALYNNCSNKDLLLEFPNRTKDTIQVAANSLGLSKDKEKLQEENSAKVKDKLLVQLKEYAADLGRTPSSFDINENCNIGGVMSYHRYFGSYNQACVEAGLKPNINIFGKRDTYFSKHNDLCLSIPELTITNLLIDNSIKYKKEVPYNDFIYEDDLGNRRVDWLIQGHIAVEYFGLMNKKNYATKAIEKMVACQENDVQIIDLYPNDLKYNFKGLIEKFQKYGIHLVAESSLLTL